MNKREVSQKRVKNLFSRIPKVKIVKYFVKEGNTYSAVYATINRMQNEGQTKKTKKPRFPTSWVGTTKAKHKRLTKNRTGISQRCLAKKFDVDQSTISRQLFKLRISYRKREQHQRANKFWLIRFLKKSILIYLQRLCVSYVTWRDSVA